MDGATLCATTDEVALLLRVHRLSRQNAAAAAENERLLAAKTASHIGRTSALMTAGGRMLQLGDYADASKAFSEVLRLQPDNDAAMRGLKEAAKGYQLESLSSGELAYLIDGSVCNSVASTSPRTGPLECALGLTIETCDSPVSTASHSIAVEEKKTASPISSVVGSKSPTPAVWKLQAAAASERSARAQCLAAAEEETARTHQIAKELESTRQKVYKFHNYCCFVYMLDHIFASIRWPS
eukprot:SAG31_NODE_2491_length_5612_cov_23.752766_2_plen_240_part_00